MSTGSEQVRDQTGRFMPGVSGNPAGRPPGRIDKRVRAREELLGPLVPTAVEKLSEALQTGERWAIELVFAYALPRPRPVDVEEVIEFDERLAELEKFAGGRN